MSKNRTVMVFTEETDSGKLVFVEEVYGIGKVAVPFAELRELVNDLSKRLYDTHKEAYSGNGKAAEEYYMRKSSSDL